MTMVFKKIGLESNSIPPLAATMHQLISDSAPINSSPNCGVSLRKPKRGSRCIGLIALTLLFSMQSILASDLSFQRDIRPILSDHCFACHGPDGNHRKADLRLDTHEGAMNVIDSSKPLDSELLRRVLAHDEDAMPPIKFNKPLHRDQVEVLKKWIEAGAPWEEHWSFAPIRRPSPEAIDFNSSLIRNPVDAMVQKKLQQKGWKAAAEADRRTLIRRVALDLTGLPPSPLEVDGFLTDSSPDAYESLVKRLLASSAFGERMAWDWLDAARYADTNGYQGDSERTMWPWRDWVVRAFNENLPFDQFTIWQLAGDLLPNATDDQKLATAFCRNHMINGEGGRIAEENRIDYVLDMTETMGTVWLGLTLNCCRCHDHKFDPLEQKDYYQLFAFFNQTPVDGSGGNPQTAPVISTPSKEQSIQLEQIVKEIASSKIQLQGRSDELHNEFPSWLKAREHSLKDSSWRLPTIKKAEANRQKLKIEKDQTILASGENPANDTYVLELVPAGDLVAIRLDVLQHESMTKSGLSRADSGNFVLTSFELFREKPNTNGIVVRDRVPIADAQATFEQGAHKINASLDDDPRSGWAVWEGRIVDRHHAAMFKLQEPMSLLPEEQLVVVMKHDSENARHNIGYFRLTTSADPMATLDDIDPSFETVLVKESSVRSKEENALLHSRHRQSDAEYTRIEQTIRTLEGQRKSLESGIPKVMVMTDRPTPRETFLLTRGLYNQPANLVSADVPKSLPPIESDAPRDRLAMARWLVSDQQPLTARVIVNRLWQQFFGVGLVKTVEDLGSQGEIPIHLDLLNYLAADFRDSHWDTKHLIETIVTSHTYRQSSSRQGSDSADDDPENRWLARGPRFRMPSWMIRDQALAASGLLNRSIGGPSVKGYQPPGIWEESSFGIKKYQQDSGEALYRRSLYIYWRRIIGPTMFFDNAARQVCTVKTVRTNTPLQALALLNDVTFVEAARALAVRALEIQYATDSTRLQQIFYRILAREPHAEEGKILFDALERSRRQFNAAPKLATDLLALGDSTIGREIDRAELASWTALCLAVLNLDETLTKE